MTTTLTTSGDASRGSAGVRFTLLFVLFMGILWVLTEGGTLLGMTISSAQTRGWIIVLGALASAWFINALAARPTKRDDSSGDAS